MCGLIHVRRSRGLPANKIVLKRFEEQRSRGTEGFGYIAVENGVIVNIVRAKTEKEIKEMLLTETASEIMFHHRMPTSTPNFIGATHPILISDSAFDFDYLVCHNGVIYNSDSLKKDHEALGFNYSTEYTETKEVTTETKLRIFFNNGYEEKVEGNGKETKVTTTSKYNDSEALAYELALMIEGWKDKIDTRGGAAILVYQVQKREGGQIGAKIEKMFYGSNSGRPLTLEAVGKKKKSKDMMVIIKSTGKGKLLDSDRLFTVDYTKKGLPVSSKRFDVGSFTPRQTTSNYNNAYWNRNTESEKKAIGFQEKPSIIDRLTQDDRDAVDRLFPDADEGRTANWDEVLQQYVIEETLEEQLAEQESKMWTDKADEIIGEMSDLRDELANCEAKMINFPYDTDVQIEFVQIKAELEDKEKEYQKVQDKLIELDLPIPSMLELNTV